MLSIVLIKFIASLDLGANRKPEQSSKYVMLHVPCYSEGPSELRLGLDSLSQTNYPDDKKLLVVVCDGMVQGSNNTAPTPEVVLDVLGVPPEKYRGMFCFQALRE